MNGVFLMLALFLELAATTSLKRSQGFSKRLPSLAMAVFPALSLTLLSFALNVKGFAVGVVYAAWSGVGVAFIVSLELFWQQPEQWNDKDIGPIGTMARIGLGIGDRVRRQRGSRPTRNAPCPRQPSYAEVIVTQTGGENFSNPLSQLRGLEKSISSRGRMCQEVHTVTLSLARLSSSYSRRSSRAGRLPVLSHGAFR